MAIITHRARQGMTTALQAHRTWEPRSRLVSFCRKPLFLSFLRAQVPREGKGKICSLPFDTDVFLDILY